MARYRVGLVQTVFEETTVYVEAPDRETAEQLALKKANSGKPGCNWSFMECVGDIEVISAELTTKAPAFILVNYAPDE